MKDPSKCELAMFEENLIESRRFQIAKKRWITVFISFLLHITVVTVFVMTSYMFISEDVPPPSIRIAFFPEQNPPAPLQPPKAAVRIPPVSRKTLDQLAQNRSEKKAPALGSSADMRNVIPLPLFESEKNKTAGGGSKGPAAGNPQPLLPSLKAVENPKGTGAAGPQQGVDPNRMDDILKGKSDGTRAVPGRKPQKPGFPITRRDLLEGVPGVPPLGQGSGGGAGGGFGFDSGFSPNLSFETKDFNWSDYASAIYMAIWRSWHNRLYLTLSNFERWSIERNSPTIDGVTGVSFVIENNGNISEISLLYGSSVEPLDVSALDALREAVLPPLPANFSKERERVTARFIAETDIKAMKQWLPIYKYWGYF